jgi:leader peptidase (prepilin peptidase)/N-methyltransferase
VYAGLFGLAFGSFANAAIDRLPLGRPLAGRSQCDTCGHALRARELVPVISYILLRGRCASCGTAIGLRTPAIEMLSATAFVAAFSLLAVPAAVAVSAACLAAVIALGVVMRQKRVRP